MQGEGCAVRVRLTGPGTQPEPKHTGVGLLQGTATQLGCAGRDTRCAVTTGRVKGCIPEAAGCGLDEQVSGHQGPSSPAPGSGRLVHSRG